MTAWRRAVPTGLLLAAVLPGVAGAQTTRQATVQIGLAQALAGEFTDARGIGVRAAFTLPRTHNIDAGLEAAFYDLGTTSATFTTSDPVFGTVVTASREEQRFGYVALMARLHLAAGPVRPVASASVGAYGYGELDVLDERTPSGALVRAGHVEFTDRSWAPGLSLGLGLEWGRSRGLALTSAFQVHGAFFQGFPTATLTVGVGYR